MMGNNRQRFGDIPVKEGETYDVEIEGIGEKGDGIARISGYVIIVPGVKKGDKVKIKVNAIRGKVSFGEVIGESQGSTEDADEAEDEDKEEAADDDADEAEEDEEALDEETEPEEEPEEEESSEDDTDKKEE